MKTIKNYPRPQFVRDSWLSLNGKWKFVFDDENAYAYLEENRAGCLDTIKEKLAERTGRDIAVTVRKNETGQNAKDVVPDLRELIQFDIVEENF